MIFIVGKYSERLELVRCYDAFSAATVVTAVGTLLECIGIRINPYAVYTESEWKRGKEMNKMEKYCNPDCGCAGAQPAKNCGFEPMCKNCSIGNREGRMKIFNAGIEVKMNHYGEFCFVVDTTNLQGEVQHSAGGCAKDLKQLAEAVGKTIVEALMEGR